MSRPMRTPRSHQPMSYRSEAEWIYTKTDPDNPKKTRNYAVTFLFYVGRGRKAFFTRGASAAIRAGATTEDIIHATAQRLSP